MIRQVAGSGSSPRLRGTLTRDALDTAIVRFIPAPAGNTARCRRWSGMPSVHPRACGEHLRCPVGRVRPDGSSPRLRGTRCRLRTNPGFSRFIPAPAGNTWPKYGPPSPHSVHPRACGEHRADHSHSVQPNGSSPRLRGTHALEPGDSVALRFIPAPAGNTESLRGWLSWHTVHPRACGEHSLAAAPR